AALKAIQCSNLQETGVYLNNSCENSHLPFRRKERSMQKFKSGVTLQIFTSIHSQIYNHFNHQRHLQKRDIFKQQRSTSLSEWRGLCAAKGKFQIYGILRPAGFSLTTPTAAMTDHYKNKEF
ncbi:MAG: putative transposase, partial [Oleispira sp.]